MKLGDPNLQMNVETVPTGSISLDIALGRRYSEGTRGGDIRTGVER